MIEHLPNALVNVYKLYFVELLLLAPALWLAFFSPECTIALWRKFFRGLETIARRKNLAILLVGLLAFTGSMAVSLLVRFPLPAIQDEFSYLLAADTFAHGRLANPTHPLWRHFESLHIIQHPTYASKYPPAQGLVLALGQVAGGHPVVGVWLSIALASASICWMLQGWVPSRWALLGGLIAALNLGFFGYWSQNYWGGALAAIAGALVFGSLRRLVRHPAVGASIMMAIGLVILANSRPFEGLIASLPAAAVILTSIFRGNGQPRRIWLVRVVAPILIVVLAGGAMMGYYNLRVTGSPWQMPYQVYERQYPSSPVFLWSSKPALAKQTAPQIFLDIQQEFLKRQQRMETVAGFIKEKSKDLLNLSLFYFRAVFLVPLVMLPWVLRNRWNAFALLIILLASVTILLETQSYPRKLAPVTCLLVFLAVQGLRHLRLWQWHGRPTGRCLTGLLVAIFVISVSISFFPVLHSNSWPVSRQRAQIDGQLQEDGHRHVILVKNSPYSYAQYPHFDWVYNRADIDAAKVIWARDLNLAQNRELVDYFKERKIWRVDVDRLDSQGRGLEPYSSSGIRK
jgi:hypothetical protein